MKPLVIYHANCPDGFTAAWVAARALGEVELYPGEYGKEPPYELARNRPVYIVDFSYPRDQLEKLRSAAGENGWHSVEGHPLMVIDHHKTAQAELAGLPYCVFDMERSGAGLTWDYFHPNKPRPWVVDYVEDRDLWRFKLPDSEALSLFIRTTSHELASWDAIAALRREDALSMALGCQLYLQHYVRDALRQAYTFEMQWSDPDEWDDSKALRSTSIVAVNVSYTGVSDVLNAALDAHAVPVALGWHLAADGQLNCSLRSVKSFDCSKIARARGGGGHAQAAGFRLTIDHPLADELLRAGK